jgi:hypothetical protein
VNPKGDAVISHLRISLRAWPRHGQVLDQQRFLDGIHAKDSGYPIVGTPPKATRVELVDLQYADFAKHEEPSEAFFAAVRDLLLKASRWLAAVPVDALNDVRGTGAQADLFIGAWIDEDQIELDLPVEFLTAAARLGLPIRLLSND